MGGIFEAIRWGLRYMRAQRFLREWNGLADSRSHREAFLRKFYEENAHLKKPGQ